MGENISKTITYMTEKWKLKTAVIKTAKNAS